MFPIATFLVTAASLTIVQARGLPGLLARIDLGGGGLTPRQVPNVPSQCISICNPVNAILSSGGCTPVLCCTADFDNSYFNCYECVAQSVGLTDYSAAQQVLDALYNQCALRGVALPQLTFPGQDPSRPLTSVVNTATTAAPSSSVATSTSPVSQTVVTAPTIIPITTSSLIQSIVTSLPTTTSSPSPTTSASSGRRAMGEVSLAPVGAVMIIGAWAMVLGCF